MKWKWRRDELSLKQFYLLPKEEKEEYILLLKGLKPEILSTNDEYVLQFYCGTDKQEKEYKFLEL